MNYSFLVNSISTNLALYFLDIMNVKAWIRYKACFTFVSLVINQSQAIFD